MSHLNSASTHSSRFLPPTIQIEPTPAYRDGILIKLFGFISGIQEILPQRKGYQLALLQSSQLMK